MMIPENDGTVATLGKTSIHQALEGLACEFAQNAQYQKQLCRTVSLDAFRAELIAIADQCDIFINNNDLEEAIELVLKVEYPYCISSPRVGFSLTDFPFLVRVRLVLGWIGSSSRHHLMVAGSGGSKAGAQDLRQKSLHIATKRRQARRYMTSRMPNWNACRLLSRRSETRHGACTSIGKISSSGPTSTTCLCIR